MFEHNWLLYAITFVMAFFITLVTVPFAKWVSFRFKAIDYPKDRGVHTEPMPRMGGIAMVLGFMLTISFVFCIDNTISVEEFTGFFVGALIIAVLGAFDDIYNLPAKFKLCVQIIAGLVVIYAGIEIEIVLWPVTATLQTFSIPITLIWIVGVTNAVNLIDGLDGLAAGVSSIAALSLTVLCIMTGSTTAVFFTVAIAGACFGFLPRNFNPAEIFMGDTGSTFLGFVLAVTSILGVFKGYALLAVCVSVLCVGLPIFDTAFAMIRRAVNGKPIMEADRGHLHHRLIDRGFSQKQAVLILYCVNVLLGCLGIFISLRDVRVIWVMLFTCVILSFIIWYASVNNEKNPISENNEKIKNKK